jgi:serine/threonine protein kinase
MTEPVLSNLAPPLQPVTHLDALPAGTRLGEFEITGLIGVGGFGMVYQAFDHTLQRDVAIKEYMPAALARRVVAEHVSVRSSADTQTFNEGLKSFMTEARLLAQFDHASLVKVFRYWEANNTAYMVMPLYRGITLRQARAGMRSPPPEEWLRKLIWSVLGALKVLHSGNTMHRDISPENIFLQDIGPPVLLDLGAARRAIHEQDQQITATLKYSYAPIEQYGEEPDLRQGPWTDLYALAAVVHGCVSNELPLPATLRVMRDRLPTFASVARRVHDEYGLTYSPSFITTIDQSLALRPAGRPKSVNGFARMMELHVPSGMSKFDWRNELGEILEPLSAAPGHAEVQATTVLLPAGATTRPAPEREQAAPAGQAPSPEITITPLFGGNARRGAPRWALWLAGLALLLLLTLLIERARDAAPQARPAAAPAAAPASVVAPELVASTIAATASPPVAASAAADAPRPVTVPLTVPERRKTVTKPATERKKPVPDDAAPVTLAPPAPSASRGDLAEAASRKVPIAVDAAPPADAARSPEANCADRNFLVRPMCLYEECKKPEFSRAALCLENARRVRESRPPRD